jgi:hypothetical protein
VSGSNLIRDHRRENIQALYTHTYMNERGERGGTRMGERSQEEGVGVGDCQWGQMHAVKGHNARELKS